ncbi:Bax inhibitor-1/YccA family protein [Actinocorallia longicatena]|uniref:Bax inhibitor-1/YccA family protein n=1 Tax=Actinocorallia longicatena TaxID=111803 RepID=A0ABP6Q283_9ACTN
MESRNPVFRSIGQDAQRGQAPSPQQLHDMYNAPAYAPPAGRTMTLDDVVVKGLMTLGLLTVTGTVAWVLDLSVGIGFVAAIIGLVIGLYLSFSGKASAPLTLAYAAFYGVAVGTISHAYNDFYNGIVFQAVIGTALAFAGMLAVYSARIIRVTPKFVRFVVAAGIALMGLMIVNLVVGLFNDTGIGIRENGPIAIAFSVVAILVGCFFLLLDFDMIERGVAGGLPEKYSWACAFAITSTLVWIYLEVLRLLAILNSSD